MGVSDSPLRDRVIFVQGAPRSGTTWLALALATHPQVAGIQAESHLFEYGVNSLFDSYDGRHPGVKLPLLRPYLEREQLVDLARDFCDGVFMSMRSRVSRGPEPPFIVEKTPTSLHEQALDLHRKRECYPDGWYLHIVRDGEAVARSLMRAPWMADRSHANCLRTWRECVEMTREALADHPRYREVSYEEMRGDPGTLAAGVFEWLGIDASTEVLDTVRALSRERFSEQAAVPTAAVSRPRIGARALRAARSPRRAAAKAVRRLRPRDEPKGTTDSPLGFNFVTALGQRDLALMRSVTSDSVVLMYRSPSGDLVVSGEEAREALFRIGGHLFDHRHINVRWSAAQGGPREWWTSTPGQPFWSIFCSAIAGDATRIDVAFGLSLEAGLIAQVTVLSVGPLAGRQLRELSGAAEPGLFASSAENGQHEA